MIFLPAPHLDYLFQVFLQVLLILIHELALSLDRQLEVLAHLPEGEPLCFVALTKQKVKLVLPIGLLNFGFYLSFQTSGQATYSLVFKVEAERHPQAEIVIIFELPGYGLEEVLVDFKLALQVFDRLLVVEYLVGSVNHHLLGAHVCYLQPDSAHLESEVPGGLLDDGVPLFPPRLALQPAAEALYCSFLERKHLRKELFLG